MGDLFTLASAGCGFILIGTHHSLTSQSHSSSLTSFTLIFIFSLLFILNSLISLFDSLSHHDRVGSALQLQIISIASLFSLYSLLGLLKHKTKFLPLPSSFLTLVSLFAFVEEFLLFYLQRKDPNGIENRYYDLMIVPIGICIVSTIIELRSGFSMFPKLARGVGLVLQGMWFVQMGFSFFSTWIVDGCELNRKSRGNYTIRCKGEMGYHRGRGIATLQFNCHLALLVVLVTGVYALVAKRNGIEGGEFRNYRPIGVEMEGVSGTGRFTLVSDEDEDEEISVVENGVQRKGGVVEMGANGYGSHR